ncbi:MAG TPA: cupin domain-containing protein [Gemmataceae bacterium]|nr:cupin domain-containing protein [Gemmataceae bacterium]
MFKRKWKFVLVAGLVACGLGGFRLGLAWATPPQGFTAESIIGPVTLDESATKIETDDWGVKFKTHGVSDLYVTRIKIVPGGHGGWHSHPGPSIIMVKSGTATFLDDCDDPMVPRVYPAGSAFVEDAECVHILGNAGDTDLEVIVIQIVPLGAPRRIDEDDPRD